MPQVSRRATVGVLCAVAGAAAPAAAQATSMGVVATIKAQEQTIKKSPATTDLKHFQANTPAQAKALIPKFAALKGVLDHAATVVSGASTSSTQQKQGKQDWVKAVREEATASGKIETGLKDAESGKKAAAKTAVLQGSKAVSTAGLLAQKADKLLGLKSS